jgi:hypothetical protein
MTLDGSELPVLRNPRRTRGPALTSACPLPPKNAVQTEREAALSTFRVLVSRHANMAELSKSWPLDKYCASKEDHPMPYIEKRNIENNHELRSKI